MKAGQGVVRAQKKIATFRHPTLLTKVSDVCQNNIKNTSPLRAKKTLPSFFDASFATFYMLGVVLELVNYYKLL